MRERNIKADTLAGKVKRWFFLEAVPLLVFLLIQFAGRTSRWVVIDGDKIYVHFHRQRPYIAVFWHSRILMIPVLFHIEGAKMDPIVMISSSDDGIFVSNVVKYCKISTAFGSSSQGGQDALREMLRKRDEKKIVLAITPDGPRGPKETVKPGPIIMGKETGIPVIGFTYHAKKVRRLKSWDRFVVVWPFNTIVWTTTDPIIVPHDANSGQMEACRKELEDKMRKATALCEDVCEGRRSLTGLPHFTMRPSLLFGKRAFIASDGKKFKLEDLLSRYP